ncbi:cytochrome P450 [Kibdelosporangium philippinense]|uniref:Cytochrome P450 n=1 Tax=Kibdelosporangium philippinense TaxID=211113 RepID=A0ABS8ZEF1_9PSEU|nr:cytochrome P450 [Kibdelosporangium philippinense]MCE7006194.1 cytochrome P450 [Kibdelosporangium philippinense]
MYDAEFFADPHPTYGRMRAEAAVHRVQDPKGLTYWLITRFDEGKAALADPRLAKDPRRAWDALRAAGMVSGSPSEATFDLHSTDPPDHTRLRDAVTKAFTPGRVEALRPRVQAIADDLVSGFGSAVDLIGDYAYPLSLTVIAELLGIPIADREQFRVWTTAAMTPPYIESAGLSREEGGRLLRQYVTDFVDAKEEADDLVSALLNTSLSRTEVITLTQQLLFAGHEPTMNLIGNGMATLLRHPAQLSLLRANLSLLPRAIDELIRFDGPTARASPRYATTDIEIAGSVIPAGSVVVVGIASANRDPLRFASPDVLDISRQVTHLAFGHGIHRCLGVPLARLEAEIGIGTLLSLSLELADELEWHPFPVFRGLKALRVSATPRR